MILKFLCLISFFLLSLTCLFLVIRAEINFQRRMNHIRKINQLNIALNEKRMGKGQCR